MLPQSPGAGVLTPLSRIEVKTIFWVAVPSAISLPNMKRLPGAQKEPATGSWNCTTTPGATVSVAPEATDTLQALKAYGIVSCPQVTLAGRVPGCTATPPLSPVPVAVFPLR